MRKVKRTPGKGLSRQVLIDAAVALADRDGIDGMSMRALAKKLRVEPMSLYHHVADKEALLDQMVDLVFSEMYRPKKDGDWREELRRRSQRGREVLKKHRWAVALMDSRSAPGMATLTHHDAVIGCLRTSGFSLALTGHAFALLDAHLFGYVVQELSLPFEGGREMGPLIEEMRASIPTDSLPHLAEFAKEHVLRPGYAFAREFDFGLELILDSLERKRREERRESR